MPVNRDIYFANLPEDELAEAVMEKVDAFFTFLKRSNLIQCWKNAYKAYYNSEIVCGEIFSTGAQNEYKNLNINHYRSWLTNLKSMIAQQKIAFDAQATNTDVKSQEQTILANGLLDYYPEEKELNDIADQALESAIALSEGWIETSWDVKSGEIYGYNQNEDGSQGSPIYEGDLRYRYYLPSQVVRDVTKQKFRDNVWFTTVDFVNKFDLMVQYPEKAEEIKDTASHRGSYNHYTLYGKYQFEETDDIPIFTLRHKRTPACPNGKLAIILDEKTTLFNGDLPYRNLSLRRLTTSDHLSWNFGYTLAYDLLIIQEGMNILDSIIITNQSTYGVQNIIAARGSNVEASQLAGGLNLIEWDPIEGGSPPAALNLTSTPAEIFNYRASLVNDGNLISGINAVARGDMSSLGKNMSGSAMALLQTMAIQYANSLQKSWIATLEGVATDTIYILRDFAKVPRVAMIAGKMSAQYMKSFVGDDLSQINRVKCTQANPLSKTVAGRLDLADKYLEHGFAKTPEDYEQVLATGKLDPVIEDTQKELMQIREENEDLVAGKPVMAVITDDHVLHILKHRIPILGDGRFKPELVDATGAHINDHLKLLKVTDPLLLSIFKQPVAQGAPPQAGGPPAPNGGPPKPGMGDAVNPESPAEQAAGKARMPSLPQSPIQ